MKRTKNGTRILAVLCMVVLTITMISCGKKNTEEPEKRTPNGTRATEKTITVATSTPVPTQGQEKPTPTTTEPAVGTPAPVGLKTEIVETERIPTEATDTDVAMNLFYIENQGRGITATVDFSKSQNLKDFVTEGRLDGRGALGAEKGKNFYTMPSGYSNSEPCSYLRLETSDGDIFGGNITKEEYGQRIIEGIVVSSDFMRDDSVFGFCDNQITLGMTKAEVEKTLGKCETFDERTMFYRNKMDDNLYTMKFSLQGEVVTAIKLFIGERWVYETVTYTKIGDQ